MVDIFNDQFSSDCRLILKLSTTMSQVALMSGTYVVVVVVVPWAMWVGSLLGFYLHVSPPLRQPPLLRPSFAIRHMTWQQWPKSNSQDRMNLGR